MMRRCYIEMMRTTIDIPEAVLKQAKIEAAESGDTVSTVVTEALRERFLRKRASSDPPWEPVVFRGERGILPGVDLTDNAALLSILDGDR